MKLGILLSGGKDSLYAAYIASKEHDIVCAITIKSENPESYMFHTPNIDLVDLQAQAMNIPLIVARTKGEKELELLDLEQAILEAKKTHNVQGIITGAVASQYQASRVEHICAKHQLWAIHPLWQIDQMQLLRELLQEKFEIIISGVFGYPLDETWLGKTIDENKIQELGVLQQQYQLNPAGEGGEIETLVIDCPLFSQRISIQESKIEYENHAGNYHITKALLEGRQ
jgi:ABC transporter with metal-binding/Fe-S-binding domain ATP-binding protein